MAGDAQSTRHASQSRGLADLFLRQDFAGGLLIMAVGAFAWWEGRGLPGTGPGGMGPGTLPRSLALLLLALGLVLAIAAVARAGHVLDRWSLRGPIFILGALVAFGLAVRPLGLAVAGPLAILLGSCASGETRWGEALLYGVLMTAFCAGLFKFALGLPIPLAPWALGY